jgi:hypothetical protein
MNGAWLVGRGLWTPGVADVFAWLEGDEDPTVTVPACSFVKGRLLRATSVLTRSVCEGAWQAAQEADFDPATTPTIFGSMHGEIQTAVDMLDTLRGEDALMSPARFKNSVHNTAAGIYSIATHNRAFTTAIAAGPSTVAMCLLEALALLGTDEERVVVTMGEEHLPPLLEPYADFPPLAVALALSRQPDGARPLARLENFRRDPSVPPPEDPSGRFAGHPTLPALLLLDRLARGEPGTVALDMGGEGWCVDLVPGGNGGA